MPQERSLSMLLRLWQLEEEATRERFLVRRRTRPLRERVAQGDALRGLSIDELTAAAGGRLLLWLRSSAPEGLSRANFSHGDPVLLWQSTPEEAEALSGIISRRERDRLGVIVDAEPEAFFDAEGFRLDLDHPRTTFERGRRALDRFQKAKRGSDRLRLHDVLFGKHAATFDERFTPPERFFDEALNPPQRAAVCHALAAEDVALIHGPPGTGKTRTLVELVRQAVARGQSVLAVAASNAAVDNLGARLADAALKVVRIGHPARVSAGLSAYTLDALLAQTDTYKLGRRLMDEANTLRRRVAVKSARGKLSYSERREALKQAYALTRDARRLLRGAQGALLDSADVICATATGAATSLLGHRRFDLVVIDEATQVTDPIALIPIARSDRVVFAGDPHQLPPTVIAPEATRGGLAVTFFESLMASDEGDRLRRLLTVQHRMNEALMAFPSESKYEGRLEAAPEVANRRLEMLEGVQEDPLRPGPLVFLDTAGKGWRDERSSDDASTSNPSQARRVSREVRRLLSRGLPPRDIAVITPYRAQALALKALLEDIEGLEVDTIDSFQGREKEAVVLDLVRSNDDSAVGFLSDTRRMNVALTRARRFLLVIGDSATLGAHPYYALFLDGAEIEGEWISAWDDDGEPCL